MEKNNKNKIPFAFTYTNPLRGLFTLAYEQPNRHCLAEPRGNMVRKYTYKELGEMVEQLALALSKTTGAERKPIAIVARSSFRAIVAHLAALLSGARVTLIPINCTPEEQQQIIADNQVELLVMDDLETGKGLIGQLPFLPQLRQLWVLEDEPKNYHAQVSTLGWSDMLQLATQGKKRITLEDQLANLSDDEKLCRFYSRSAAGEFHQHDYSLNELGIQIKQASARAKLECDAFTSASKFLSIIPFNRVMSHVEGIFLPLMSGRMLMAVDRQEAWKSETLPYDADCLVANSLFLNNAASKVTAEINDQGGIGYLGFSKNLSRLKRKNNQKKPLKLKQVSQFDELIGKFVNFLLNRKLRETFSGNIKLCLAIDDKLRYESRLFYQSLTIPLFVSTYDDLIIKPTNEAIDGMAFNAVRGTQLAKNKDLKKLKIVS